jgi:hypothetical protein
MCPDAGTRALAHDRSVPHSLGITLSLSLSTSARCAGVTWSYIQTPFSECIVLTRFAKSRFRLKPKARSLRGSSSPPRNSLAAWFLVGFGRNTKNGCDGKNSYPRYVSLTITAVFLRTAPPPGTLAGTANLKRPKSFSRLARSAELSCSAAPWLCLPLASDRLSSTLSRQASASRTR